MGQVCLRLGTRIQLQPQEDRDEPGHWALFFFDPDAMRSEVAALAERPRLKAVALEE
jgi:hypothetical protein